MVSPVLVVVAAIVSTTTSWVSRGRLRQFMVIAENIRCSILFHFEVPGGRWHTVIPSPVSVAGGASWVFHSRNREPLDPPPSAVISSRFAPGEARPPIVGPPAADRLDREHSGVGVGA